jgi:hypothetical protein
MKQADSLKRPAASVNRKENGFGLLKEDTSVQAISTPVSRERHHQCAACLLTGVERAGSPVRRAAAYWCAGWEGSRKKRWTYSYHIRLPYFSSE